MKAKAFLFASLCAMSLSLVACGGKTDETPASEVDTTMATPAPSAPTVDTTAGATTPAPTDTTAGASTGTSTSTDTTAHSDTTK
jgi:hypothetical protein